jgi:hypothetical protein
MSFRVEALVALACLSAPVDEHRLGCGMGAVGNIVDQDGDGRGAGIDCDDEDPERYPGAPERCNDIDDDCDGEVDEDFDADGDGYRDALLCDGPLRDCDDREDDINPGAIELCNGLDDDCNGLVDDEAIDGVEAWPDQDGDGYGAEGEPWTSCSLGAGWATQGGDCDDQDNSIHPGRQETCNDIDEDCDGVVDEDASGILTFWYLDSDGDGWGERDVRVYSCAMPPGHVLRDGDCDDLDPLRHPWAEERCNQLDDDCDGITDEDPVDGIPGWTDQDGDGWGDEERPVVSCPWDATTSRAGDCDDGEPAAHPDAEELCDGIDNDCDGQVDLDALDPSWWYQDTDGDGWGDDEVAVEACDPPTGFVAAGGDCDDANDIVNPGAFEVMGTGDIDCDGVEPTEAAASCLELLDEGLSGGDGLYTIDPDSYTGPIPQQQVWCDMSTAGGGWTLVQRTVWDWSETQQLMTDYDHWYGISVGDPQPGHAYRLEGRAWDDLDASHDHLLVVSARDDDDHSDCAPLYYRESSTTVSVDASVATLSGWESSGDIFSYGSLSTTDSGDYSVCTSAPYWSVPWFHGMCCLTCPSHKGSHWSDAPHPMVQYLDTTADIFGQLDSDVCPSGTALNSGSGAYSFEGVNTLEYYLR